MREKLGLPALWDFLGVQETQAVAPANPDSVCASQTPGSTSPSLLERVKAQDPAGWRRLVRLYGPLIYLWARRSGLQPADAGDVVQDVFGAVLGKLKEFRRERPGDSFRAWLFSITRNKVRDVFRGKRDHAVARGGTDAHEQLHQFAALPGPCDDPPPVSGDGVALRAAELIRGEFAANTYRAFWRTAIDGQKAAAVADELDMSVPAVSQAKYRVLRRLRQELAGMGLGE